jgi:hypothetical protein
MCIPVRVHAATLKTPWIFAEWEKIYTPSALIRPSAT